jgi:O-antigen ligase
LIFLIVLVGGSYLTPDSLSGIKKAILFALAVVLPYMMARVFFKTYKQIKVFLITIISLAAGIAIILIFMSFLPTYTSGRLFFFEANPIPTGTLLAVGLVIAVIGLSSDLLSKSRQSKAICIAFIPLCLFGIFLSGVRGPFVSAIVGLAFYLLILYKQRPMVLISMAGIVLFLLVTFNILYPVIASKVPNIRAYSPEVLIQGNSVKERLERYQGAIKLFAQRPWLGGGTNSYSQRTKLDEYPHNIFLEIISENGLIGLLVFLGFLGSIVWAGFRYLAIHRIRLDPHERAIGLAVLTVSLILLVEKQFSYSLTMHKELFAFLGIIVNLPDLSSSPNVKASKNAVK